MSNLPMSHDNIRAILAGNVRPTELLAKCCYQLLDEVEAEAADCSTFGKAHEQAVEMLKTARAERDKANAILAKVRELTTWEDGEQREDVPVDEILDVLQAVAR